MKGSEMKKYSYNTIDANGQKFVVLGIYYTANSALEALKKVCKNTDLSNAIYVEVFELSY
jgi:hypothetical protein